jgi:hypothetical protein
VRLVALAAGRFALIGRFELRQLLGVRI